jgi:hypothetical protein
LVIVEGEEIGDDFGAGVENDEHNVLEASSIVAGGR